MLLHVTALAALRASCKPSGHPIVAGLLDAQASMRAYLPQVLPKASGVVTEWRYYNGVASEQLSFQIWRRKGSSKQLELRCAEAVTTSATLGPATHAVKTTCAVSADAGDVVAVQWHAAAVLPYTDTSAQTGHPVGSCADVGACVWWDLTTTALPTTAKATATAPSCPAECGSRAYSVAVVVCSRWGGEFLEGALIIACIYGCVGIVLQVKAARDGAGGAGVDYAALAKKPAELLPPHILLLPRGPTWQDLGHLVLDGMAYCISLLDAETNNVVPSSLRAFAVRRSAYGALPAAAAVAPDDARAAPAAADEGNGIGSDSDGQ